MKKKILTIVALFAPLFITGCWQTGDSEYVGVVTKIGNVGAIWTTYEAELHLTDSKGTMVADSVEVGIDASGEHGENVSNLISQLKDAQNKGTRVKITCKREIFVAPWRSEVEGNRLIQSIELLQ